MQIDTKDAGVLLFVATRQQTGDDARQYIATASSSHAGIACGIEQYIAVGQADGSMVSLQDDKAFQPLCQVTGFGQPFVAVGTVSFQSVELLGVRCKDNALWQLL